MRLAVSLSLALVLSNSGDTALQDGPTGWELTLIWKNDAALGVQKDTRKRWFAVVVWSARRIKTSSLMDLWTSCWSEKRWLCQKGPGSHQDQGHTSNHRVSDTGKEGPGPVVGCTIPRSHFLCHVCLPSWIFCDLFTFTFDSLWHYLQFTSSPLAPSLTTHAVWGRSGAWAGVNWSTCNNFNGIYSSHEPGPSYFIPDLSFLQHFTVRVYGNLCHYTNYTNCH